MSEFRGFRDSDIQESKPRVQRFQGFRYLGELTKSSEVSGIQIFRRVNQEFRSLNEFRYFGKSSRHFLVKREFRGLRDLDILKR